MDLPIFNVRMNLMRRRPLGERAGQLLNCPSELIQTLNLKAEINKIQ
jgi:hypothetical protein